MSVSAFIHKRAPISCLQQLNVLETNDWTNNKSVTTCAYIAHKNGQLDEGMMMESLKLHEIHQVTCTVPASWALLDCTLEYESA